MNSGSEKEESPVTISRYAWTANPPAGWQWDLFELDHDSTRGCAFAEMTYTDIHCRKPSQLPPVLAEISSILHGLHWEELSIQVSIYYTCIAYPMFNISMYKYIHVYPCPDLLADVLTIYVWHMHRLCRHTVLVIIYLLDSITSTYLLAIYFD